MSGKKRGGGSGSVKDKAYLKRLASQLANQARKLSLEEARVKAASTRHMVLCDFVLHQEMVLYILKHGLPLPPAPALLADEAGSDGGGGGASPPGQEQQEQRQCVAPDGSIAPVPGVESYIAHCIRTASAEHLEEVSKWTGEEDIKQLTNELFLKLVALLELLGRAPPEGAELPQDDDGDLVDPDESLAAPGGGDSRAHVSGWSGGASGAGGGGGASTSAAGATTQATVAAAALDPTGGMRQLEALVDRAVTLTSLGLVFNSRPILDSALANHLVNQPTVAPSSHWRAVVRRLNLTEEQAFQLRVAADEYARLSKAALAEGKALLQQSASTPGVLAARAEARVEAGDEDSSPGGSGGAAVAGDDRDGDEALEAGSDDGAEPELADLFQRHLDIRLLHMTLLSFFLLNTLSKHQIAQMIVASYPLQVVSAAVVEAAAQMHREREREREREQEQQRQQRGRGGDDTPAPAAAPNPAAERHFQCRCELMQRQLRRWWHDLGALP